MIDQTQTRTKTSSPPDLSVLSLPESERAMLERIQHQQDWIETFTGKIFNLAEPVFDIEDIAFALSMNCRYNGHCSQFYSVAEHSALVSMLMSRFYGGDPFEGLMHDALEAYLTDVPSPIKALLPDYKTLDNILDRALRKQFGLSPVKSPECKRADRVALFIEAYHLLPSKGEAYADPNNDRAEALKLMNETGIGIVCMEPSHAYALFKVGFEQLNPNKSRIIVP